MGNCCDANPKLLQFPFLFLFGERAEHQNIVPGSFDHTGVRGQAQARIEDHPQERAAARTATAVGEKWVVGNHGTNTDQNRVVLMAKFLDMSPGGFTGDPGGTLCVSCHPGCAIKRLSWRRRDLAVECHGSL